MSIARLGRAAVKRVLSRWETPLGNAFRGYFIDLDELVRSISHLGPARRILEIGCGDGLFATRLLQAFPESGYLGIDIIPGPGRLFAGDPARAEFRTVTTSDLLASDPEPFDLVILVDVIHHVPHELRHTVLEDAARLTAESGSLVVKDWERDRTLTNFLAYAADRYLFGDPNTSLLTAPELREKVGTAAQGFTPAWECRIPPQRNNVLLVMRRG